MTQIKHAMIQWQKCQLRLTAPRILSASDLPDVGVGLFSTVSVRTWRKSLTPPALLSAIPPFNHLPNGFFLKFQREPW
ncbi:MAG: hypothetical protein KIS86_06565 [Devosia sp.]|nr:hypothetical protein [Devosia sp.]